MGYHDTVTAATVTKNHPDLTITLSPFCHQQLWMAFLHYSSVFSAFIESLEVCSCPWSSSLILHDSHWSSCGVHRDFCAFPVMSRNIVLTLGLVVDWSVGTDLSGIRDIKIDLICLNIPLHDLSPEEMMWVSFISASVQSRPGNSYTAFSNTTIPSFKALCWIRLDMQAEFLFIWCSFHGWSAA